MGERKSPSCLSILDLDKHDQSNVSNTGATFLFGTGDPVSLRSASIAVIGGRVIRRPEIRAPSAGHSSRQGLRSWFSEFSQSVAHQFVSPWPGRLSVQKVEETVGEDHETHGIRMNSVKPVVLIVSEGV